MDAHLLRRIGLELAGQLLGARIETVYRPVDAVFSFKISKPARRPYLLVRHGADAVCLLCLQKPDNPPTPDAVAMRLRKYLSGRRICGVWLDWEHNALCLEFAPGKTSGRAPAPLPPVPLNRTGEVGPATGVGLSAAAGSAAADTAEATDNTAAPTAANPAGALTTAADNPATAATVAPLQAGLFLCLDQRHGPRLAAALPECSEPLHRPAPRPWEIRAALAALNTPDVPAPGAPAEAADATQTRRRFPFLTPRLRATLAGFSDPADALALLADLEGAAGGIFAYGPPPPGPNQSGASAPAAWPYLCAWPLPAPPAHSRPERVYSSALEALEAEITLPFFNRLHRDRTDAATRELKRAEQRARRALDRLDAEEQRLQALSRLKADALLLQAALYQLDKTARPAAITLPDPAGGQHEIRLNPDKSILENMEQMFKQAAKAARGFPHVQRRRAELERTLQELKRENPQLLPTAETRPGTAALPAKSRRDAAGTMRATGAPGTSGQAISRFQSPAGLTVLRGKNAKGNRDCLKLAAPYDLWLHAEGGPSAHVIIKLPHPAFVVPEADLEMAARLVAAKSWQREAGRATIICTPARYVHAIKGAPHGTVKVERIWRTISVSL